MSVNEWIGVISFAIGVLGGIWRIGKTLNNTLSQLSYQIERLNDNLTEGKRDRERLHARIDRADDTLDGHEVRLTVLEDWRKGHKH